MGKATASPLCHICQRVMWGSPVYLGYGKVRHDACHPGSPDWCLYYTRLPAHLKTSEGDALLKHHVVRTQEKD